MLDWLACFAFNWFQRDLCLQLNINIRCRRNSANTLSVEFAAKSFFPIFPEIKKRIHGDECISATPVDAVFQPYVSVAPPSKVLQWNKHSQKQKGSIPDQNIQKRCKEWYQKNLFRLSFKPDLANCGRLTKIDFTHWRQRFSTTRNVFNWSTGRAMHLGWTWAFNTSRQFM